VFSGFPIVTLTLTLILITTLNSAYPLIIQGDGPSTEPPNATPNNSVLPHLTERLASKAIIR